MLSDTKCPECGKTIQDAKVWKQCPKHGGKIVCIECCMKCEYYFKNEAYIAHGCRFGAEQWHEHEEDQSKRLKMIEAQIEALYKKQEYYYRNSWPNAARKVEGEINRLIREKAELTA